MMITENSTWYGKLTVESVLNDFKSQSAVEKNRTVGESKFTSRDQDALTSFLEDQDILLDDDFSEPGDGNDSLFAEKSVEFTKTDCNKNKPNKGKRNNRSISKNYNDRLSDSNSNYFIKQRKMSHSEKSSHPPLMLHPVPRQFVMNTNRFTCNLTKENGTKCDISFKRPDELTRHMNTLNHSIEKTSVFICPWIHNDDSCLYSTSRKDNFDAHIRTHTKEKPFTCPYEKFVCNTWQPCKYASNRQDDFAKHELKMHLFEVESGSDYEITKTISKKTRTGRFDHHYSIPQNQRKMNAIRFRARLQANPAFIKMLSIKIMKKWNANYNKHLRDRKFALVDEIESVNRKLPCLMGDNFLDSSLMTVPRLKFSDFTFELRDFEFEGSFRNYLPGVPPKMTVVMKIDGDYVEKELKA